MLRTVLTVMIIALGITALVVVNTAIKAINQKFTESFSTMGASGFTIRYKDRNIRFGGGGEHLWFFWCLILTILPFSHR